MAMTVFGATRRQPCSVHRWTPHSATSGRFLAWYGTTIDTAPGRWLYARSSSVGEWSTQSFPWL